MAASAQYAAPETTTSIVMVLSHDFLSDLSLYVSSKISRAAFRFDAIPSTMYATLAPDYGRPANRPAFGGTVPLFYQMSRVPLNHGIVPLFVRSRIFLARAQFVTLPRCPEVNANHPIERNYGNSVRFLAKIPNGTAAESPCYSVFWNAIDFCRLYTSKKNLNVGPANRPAFFRQVPLFYAKCPSKNILQVGRSVMVRYRLA